MNVVLNDKGGVYTYAQALTELARGADTLSIAVAYLKVAGWRALRHRVGPINIERLRLVCTSQMSITQPAAIKLALAQRAQVRDFSGDVTYHPKVYIAHDKSGAAIRYLLGSANLSAPALSDSVEVGLIGDDCSVLSTLNSWFDELFTSRSAEITSAALGAMEEEWRAAAAARAVNRLRARASRGRRKRADRVEAEDLEVVEDVFAAIDSEIGLLNIDYARNNIRTIKRARDVIADWPSVSVSKASLAAKQRSELKLLGFADGNRLTELGRAAAIARSDSAVAELWCAWLRRTDEGVLQALNVQLLQAKEVFRQFWGLRPEVREYFLSHAARPKEKVLLQTIELLCNSKGLGADLSLDDVRALEPVLQRREKLPDHVREAVEEYFDNKGARSWDTTDRHVIPAAWKLTA